MRPLVLVTLLAGLGLSLTSLSPALAQSAQTPPSESAPLPTRQGLAMEMPSLNEDEALKAAIAAPTRSAEDRARDDQRHPYETLTFWGLLPGVTVVEL